MVITGIQPNNLNTFFLTVRTFSSLQAATGTVIAQIQIDPRERILDDRLT